jgi:hypothetical protein
LNGENIFGGLLCNLRLENYIRDGYNGGMMAAFLRKVARTMGWTRASYYLLSGFVLLCGVIVYAWWPLAEELLAYIDWSGPWWLYFDWLLVGIWLAMSLLIMAGADLRADAWIVLVGFAGGLVIESWGTQTEIWWYYTAERPPLWIIPAWPITSLSIDRLVRILQHVIPPTTKRTKNHKEKSCAPLRVPSWFFHILYWLVFPAFYALMLAFVWPTLDKSFTILALLLVTFLILTPSDARTALLTFVAGSGLGYFLEYWGTTRECWSYYTLATPPVFAVFAHGMAAVAFWRAALILRRVSWKIGRVVKEKATGSQLIDPAE